MHIIDIACFTAFAKRTDLTHVAGKNFAVDFRKYSQSYKSILPVRLPVKAGAEVKVAMTPAAKDFAVTPLTLSTLSKNPVITEPFSEAARSNHVMLGRWADVMVVMSPLSRNTLAKNGAGTVITCRRLLYLSATRPVAVAPAMDEHYVETSHSPICKTAITRANHIIPVEKAN